ncbi:unnamed protein product [Lampetra fluviatilis]
MHGKRKRERQREERRVAIEKERGNGSKRVSRDEDEGEKRMHEGLGAAAAAATRMGGVCSHSGRGERRGVQSHVASAAAVGGRGGSVPADFIAKTRRLGASARRSCSADEIKVVIYGCAGEASGGHGCVRATSRSSRSALPAIDGTARVEPRGNSGWRLSSSCRVCPPGTRGGPPPVSVTAPTGPSSGPSNGRVGPFRPRRDSRLAPTGGLLEQRGHRVGRSGWRNGAFVAERVV